MPAPVLKAMAKKAGITLPRAEKLWKMAKKQAKEQGRDEDYAYVMGIFKKAAKVESVDIIDSYIESVLAGKDPKEVIE